MNLRLRRCIVFGACHFAQSDTFAYCSLKHTSTCTRAIMNIFVSLRVHDSYYHFLHYDRRIHSRMRSYDWSSCWFCYFFCLSLYSWNTNFVWLLFSVFISYRALCVFVEVLRRLARSMCVCVYEWFENKQYNYWVHTSSNMTAHIDTVCALVQRFFVTLLTNFLIVMLLRSEERNEIWLCAWVCEACTTPLPRHPRHFSSIYNWSYWRILTHNYYSRKDF